MPIHDIITEVDPASSGSTGQFYWFDCDEMKRGQNLTWYPFPDESFKKSNKNESAKKIHLIRF